MKQRFLLCAVFLVACGGVQQPAVDLTETAQVQELEGALVFFPGETFEWRLSVARVEGGVISMAVGAPGAMDEKSVVIVASRVENAGLGGLFFDADADLTTWIDVAAGVPIKHRAVLSDGTKSESIDAAFSRGKIDLVRVGGSAGEDRPSRMVSPNAWPHNTSSLMLRLRNWTAPKGATATFEFLAHSRVWRATMKMGDIEQFKGPAGTFNARRVDGTAVRMTSIGRLQPDSKRNFSFFYSDDALRLPLSAISDTKFGKARLELTGYRNGTTVFPAENGG